MTMKKGQAAMEFLMTYGWAILVVLAAIGALAYFGVLSPSKFVPEKCTLEPGISCADFKVTPSETTLVLRNGQGNDLTINSVTVGSCSITGQNITFDNGQQTTVELTGCSNGDDGTRYSEDVEIQYTRLSSGLTKTHTGSITAKVQG